MQTENISNWGWVGIIAVTIIVIVIIGFVFKNRSRLTITNIVPSSFFTELFNGFMSHWIVKGFITLFGVWLLFLFLELTFPSIATNISSTVQTTGYSVADSWSENKKAHDQKTGNGNYIPTRISADIDITAEKKVLWCKPGFKTGPIQLESSGLETFFFDVDEIRLNPVGTKTILVMDKLKPTCTFGKGNYYIFIPKNILADTSETDAGIFIEIKKAITAK